MTEQEQFDQAIEQLRQRREELVRLGLAPAHELARDIDQLQVAWIERYTTPRGQAFSWDDYMRKLPQNTIVRFYDGEN